MANEVRIIITADDDSGQTLAQLKGGIEGVGDGARKASGGVRQFAEATARGARDVESAFHTMTRLDLVQITLSQSQDRVTAAQHRLNAAMLESGPGSQQAQQASRELQKAHEDLEKANLRAQMSMGLVAVQSLDLAVKSIPALRAAYMALSSAQTTAAVSAAYLNITMTAGVAAISIVAGITAVKMAMDSLGSSTDRTTASFVAFSSAGADARLEGTRQRVSQLSGEIQALEKDIDFEGWKDWPNWGDTPGNREKLRELYDERARLSSGLTDMEKGATELHKRLADEWVAAERQRVIETTGSIEEVRASLESYRKVVEGIKVKLDSPIDEKTRADTEDKLNDAERHVDSLGQRMQKLGQDADTALGEFRSGLQAVGVELGSLNVSDLAAIAGKTGPLAMLAEQARAAAFQERAMAAEMLKSGVPALAAQASVALRKGETMDQLVDSLGLTDAQERELYASGRITTQGLISQAEAADQAKTAILSLAEAQAAATTKVPGAYGMPEVSRESMIRIASGAGWVDTFASQLPEQMRLNPDFARSVAIPRAALPLRAAANGFDGMVTKPTLFLTGEAGAEHVKVTPGGRGGAGGGPGVGTLVIKNYLQPGEGTEAGVERAILRAFGIGQRRLAVRRTY